MSFSNLGLSPEVLKAIEDAGYVEPTPIQREAIPYVLMTRDVLGGDLQRLDGEHVGHLQPPRAALRGLGRRDAGRVAVGPAEDGECAPDGRRRRPIDHVVRVHHAFVNDAYAEDICLEVPGQRTYGNAQAVLQLPPAGGGWVQEKK